jgi:hypothetical protein
MLTLSDARLDALAEPNQLDKRVRRARVDPLHVPHQANNNRLDQLPDILGAVRRNRDLRCQLT